MTQTWYDRAGSGDPLVLLHPGGVDSRVVATLVPGLAETFEVFRPDRRGHGRTPDVPGPISYDLVAHDTAEFLEEVVGGPAALEPMVALRSGLPDAQLAVVPAAGHALPLDRPELFTLLVTEFLTTAER